MRRFFLAERAIDILKYRRDLFQSEVNVALLPCRLSILCLIRFVIGMRFDILSMYGARMTSLFSIHTKVNNYIHEYTRIGDWRMPSSG